MDRIGLRKSGNLIYSDGLNQMPKGFKSLFINSYVNTISALAYYRPIEPTSRYNLLADVARELANEAKFIIYTDNVDEDNVYSMLVYTVSKDTKVATVHFCFTKYNMRNLGICKYMLSELLRLGYDQDTIIGINHSLPKKIGDKYSLWKTVPQTKPYYPRKRELKEKKDTQNS